MSEIAHWKLKDNLATNVVIDETGVNNGTLTDPGGTATTATHSVKGIVDRAQIFDGVDDKITVSADPSIDAKDKTALSISAWIKPTSSGRIVDKHDSSGKGYRFWVDGGGLTLRALIEHDSTAAEALKVNILTVGAWNHIVSVYNEDGSKKIKLYLNGVLQALNTDTAGVGTISDDSSEELRIGTDESDGNNFTGLIDNVIIYDHALSASEVLQLYQDGAVPFSRSRYSGNSAVRLPRRRFSPNSSF